MRKGFLAILLIIIATLLIGGGFYLITKEQTALPPTSLVKQSSGLTSHYYDDLMGFNISYPPNFEISNDPNGGSISIHETTTSQNATEGKGLLIAWGGPYSGKSIEEVFSSGVNFRSDIVEQIDFAKECQQTTIAGEAAYDCYPTALQGAREILLSHQGIIFELIDYDRNSTTSQILSTLNFGFNTAEWQTYRNEKYGFEIKYPQNFSIRDGTNNGGAVEFVYASPNQNNQDAMFGGPYFSIDRIQNTITTLLPNALGNELSTSTITVGGTGAVVAHYIGGGMQYIDAVYIPRNGYVYEIMLSGYQGVLSAFYNEVLSMFKFTN
jgi:hypothetical protein